MFFNLNRTIANPKQWNKKKRRSPLFVLSIFLISLLFFFFFFPNYTIFSTSSKTANIALSQKYPHCETRFHGEKFLWYAPHSGFSNQLSELKNAILMASILNRTLIVPPILDHHAVALGSCPKFRVQSPKEIRISVWDHIVELLRSRRYASMADIIDISSLLSSSLVRAIDFRVFVSLWCGLNIDLVCSNESNALPSLVDSLKQCGSLLSGIDVNTDRCLFAVDEDCRSTVWTYQNGVDGTLDSFQPDEQLKKKKKIPYVRRRRDVYKALGPGSEADPATVLAFGSLFTSPYKGTELYIDIQKAPGDPRIDSLISKIEFLPFVPEIINSGKQFATQTIKAPFLCAQLRLLDGQFKNHWKATFLGLRQKLDSLRQAGSQPIHFFLMTDLPRGNWTGNYLGDLARDSANFKLYFLQEEDHLVMNTAKKLTLAGRGLRFESVPGSLDAAAKVKHCSPDILPDVLLYIEETVCSCASLGFVGTAGSTIAQSIEVMRKFGLCSSPARAAF
ncbi:Acyl-CoA oxidase 1 [Hibiscus syriacus]|uniref:Acyl-CoA oxidase 1 n=1 Tax=Hibiscus syriacus TaxID=106335 RepID=A0A6A3A266_HIBSY|nr:O-fucosyltransferase 30-like [Hibiscus syriacus]KAE8698113.1 Acyl-CoA oxidase 1 [Hibiscus syriacus]